MKLPETSYLVDYEKGREAVKTYYDAHDHEAFAASTISMFQLALGYCGTDGESYGSYGSR